MHTNPPRLERRPSPLTPWLLPNARVHTTFAELTALPWDPRPPSLTLLQPGGPARTCCPWETKDSAAHSRCSDMLPDLNGAARAAAQAQAVMGSVLLTPTGTSQERRPWWDQGAGLPSLGHRVPCDLGPGSVPGKTSLATSGPDLPWTAGKSLILCL